MRCAGRYRSSCGISRFFDTLVSDDDPVVDPLDTGVAPSDRWAGANRFGTTPDEALRGESLDSRLAAEEPDLDPYADPPEDADEDETVRRGYERDARAGRLVTYLRPL